MHHLKNTTSDDPTGDLEPVISDRARALALDILHRIRPVCANMPEGELLALSTRMALVELRYFERAADKPAARHRVANG
jgi:hypothetical protein